ncbi:SGNH/GDSL hydrolase family protein [Noviherbaspirillum cavernae]|uniref:SGNH/GDSL hydrolase family protein n=1 Tax=Noviherbaspirillum cavernae TaxID=2320862 RepID=A0A418WXG5_9BURK|nr:SGNH/GDSL hydrolase family protein [Noviherbaspirillum cavernae]RJG04803.1 SGNH/GDSL hydrolase family protein [Noviherbaspirillum cavernae]
MKRLKFPALLALASLFLTSVAGAEVANAGNWVGTWTASPQPVWDAGFALPTNIPVSLSKQTIRQTAGVSLGGNRVRIVLSNEYGTHPVTIGAAHIALAATTSRIAAGSDRTLTFGGQHAVTIPPGAPVISDPVDLSVAPLDNVAVSLYLPEATPLSTFHWDGLQTAWIAAGNRVGAQGFDTADKVVARLFLSGILVDAPSDTRAVIAFGDSITDGNNSSVDANRRWPDYLAKRLAGKQVAVLNAGISGARLLKDGMGVNALARFERDVLSQPHAKTVIVLMGINDISWPGTVFAPHDPMPSANEIIAGYRQLIARARAHNVRIIGATLTPFEGALEGSPITRYHTTDKERLRQTINQWIRSSGEFDAVVDFDVVTRDPKHPARLLPAFDSGDHLHLGDAGNKAVADAIDLDVLFGHD